MRSLLWQLLLRLRLCCSTKQLPCATAAAFCVTPCPKESALRLSFHSIVRLGERLLFQPAANFMQYSSRNVDKGNDLAISTSAVVEEHIESHAALAAQSATKHK